MVINGLRSNPNHHAIFDVIKIWVNLIAHLPSSSQMRILTLLFVRFSVPGLGDQLVYGFVIRKPFGEMETCKWVSFQHVLYCAAE